MRYFKQVGSVYDTFYGLDEETKTLLILEFRYSGVQREIVEAVVISTCSADLGTYSLESAEVIKTYTEISAKMFKAAKQDASEYAKRLEELE